MQKKDPIKREKYLVVASINGFTAFLCGGLRSWTLRQSLAHHFNVQQYAEDARAKAVKWFSQQAVKDVRVLPLRSV